MKIIKQNQGMTLVELLVGILLTSMIFLAASSLITVLFTSNTRSKQLDRIQQTKNDLFNELSNAVKWGAKIEVISNDLIVITYPDATGIDHTYTYTYDPINNILNKQTDASSASPLHESNVWVTSFTITSLGINNSDPDVPKSLAIDISLQDAMYNSINEAFRIVASQRSVDTSL